MTTPAKRRERFSSLEEKYRSLYDSMQANLLNEELQEKYGIPEEKSPAYLHATGDVILGFYKIADLPQLLQTKVGLEKEVAQKLTADLIDAWEPIVAREEADTQAKKESLSDLADSFAEKRETARVVPSLPPIPGTPEPQAAAPAPATPESEPAASETVIDLTPATPPDMPATDSAPVHGYGALPENKTSAETPKTEEEPLIKATSQSDIKINL